MSDDMWSNHARSNSATMATVDIVGYEVEALDGSIGKVHETLADESMSRIVVDTGPWIFGKKVVLPAAVIDRVDPVEETVYVHRTKEQIKNAPELKENEPGDTYLQRLGAYYGMGGPGYQSWDESGW
jgi:hypothetical protein